MIIILKNNKKINKKINNYFMIMMVLGKIVMKMT